MSRTIDQLAETGSSAPDDYLIKRNTTTGADQRISVENFTNFPAMPQVNGAPIVESGSNSDGEWTRWADGTQSAYQESNSEAVRSFPQPFVAAPVVAVADRRVNMTEIQYGIVSIVDITSTTLETRTLITDNDGNNWRTSGLNGNYVAFGRWK